MNDYIAAVFGLIGTGVGAATTLIPPILSDKRTAKDAAAKATREAQVTALLLVDDLDLARRRLRGAYRSNNGKFWSADFSLPLTTWSAGRSEIAHNLSPAIWATVAPAFRELSEIEKAAVAARSGESAARPTLTADESAWMKRTVEDVLPPAISALAAFAKSPEPVSPE